jgi:transcriptional repressor of dcmA and dcmR
MAIEHGSHLGAFYENDAGRMKLAVPFLAEGLRAGDVCFLVAARTAKDHILHHLARARGELDDDLARGKLLLMTGAPDGDAQLNSLENVFMESTRVGGHSLRLLGDMAWCFEAGMDLDTLMDFERRYHHVLARRFPVVALCQYDARLFPGVSLLQALRTHEDTFRFPLGRFLN